MGQEQGLAGWKDRQQNEAIFRLKTQNPVSEASRLLEIGDTNRTVTDREAKLMVALLAQEQSLGDAYAWVGWFVECVEKYQLTVGEPRNSREVFAKVLTATLRDEKEKSRGLFDRLMGKLGGAADSMED